MRVEIWSDVVCPWCDAGTRRFEQALERLAERDGGGDDIEVVHRAFELERYVDPSNAAVAQLTDRHDANRRRRSCVESA